MAITVGDKEVYKIIQNGKLQRVVNKGDKQLFRGDQLKPVLVKSYDYKKITNENYIACATLDNNLFFLQTIERAGGNKSNLRVYKRKNDELELIEKIENISGLVGVTWARPLKIAKTIENNIAVYGIDNYIYLFSENGKFILKKEVRSEYACHTDKYFFFRSGNGNKPLKVLNLNYDVVETHEKVIGMAIFDNGKQIRLKIDGVYLFEKDREKLIIDFQTEGLRAVTDKSISYNSNKNYFAVVGKYFLYDGHVVFLFNKNGELIYKAIAPYEEDEDNSYNEPYLFFDEYNAVYVSRGENKSQVFFKVDLDGNVIRYDRSWKFDSMRYINKKQEFTRTTIDREKIHFYKNRHLK